ncbi:MAG: carbohydrate ABC transporter permease, partial [Candidatus Hydrogenedentes bacterium]|nr:carbohydrate ABC transporter permease [Candidatus Hydrogenedentota bacterium]
MKALGLWIALAAGAAIVSWPFLWMLSTSLETLAEASTSGLGIWPKSWNWSNYGEVFAAAPFGRYFLNTFIVATAVTAAVMANALCAGYAFARLEFRGRGALFAIVIATMMIP